MSLRDIPVGERTPGRGSFDCVFWSDDGCIVYEDRPIQCSTYPFWDSVVDSIESWMDEARVCPGIGSGELRSRAYIEERLLARREARTIVFAYGADPECMNEDTFLGRSRLGPDPAYALQGEEQDIVDSAEDSSEGPR